jgi:hypothetical protein
MSTDVLFGQHRWLACCNRLTEMHGNVVGYRTLRRASTRAVSHRTWECRAVVGERRLPT